MQSGCLIYFENNVTFNIITGAYNEMLFFNVNIIFQFITINNIENINK